MPAVFVHLFSPYFISHCFLMPPRNQGEELLSLHGKVLPCTDFLVLLIYTSLLLRKLKILMDFNFTKIIFAISQ
jgi:hypothetical protein